MMAAFLSSRANQRVMGGQARLSDVLADHEMGDREPSSPAGSCVDTIGCFSASFLPASLLVVGATRRRRQPV